MDFLGFKPDIVINVDGFNEIALTLSENKNLKIPAIYPRSFSRYIKSSSNSRLCGRFNNFLLNINTQVPVFEIFTWTVVGFCQYIVGGKDDETPWWSEHLNINENTNYLKESINIWYQSSNKINEFLSSKKIPYIHTLQPNQYFPNSKKFSKFEKDNLFSFPFYGDQIKNYYHLLKPDKINAKNFIDHRFLFLNVKKTVYSDNCCHFNQLGMTIMIDDILEKNRDVFKNLL